MKKALHIIIFLVITLGLHFGFKAIGMPGSLAALYLIPYIYAFIHLVKSIINLIKGKKEAFVNSLAIALLFGLISTKIAYVYYNLELAIIILVFAMWLTRRAWKKDADDNLKKNRITLTVLLVLDVFLICIPNTSILQYIETPKVLQWQKLKFEDFQGAVPNNSPYGAETVFAINYKINSAFNYPVAEVDAEVSPNRSWMKTMDNTSHQQLLLEHEQIHFDIAEFYKRKICDSISGEWGRPAKEVEGIISYWISQMDSMQDIYDKSTNHGSYSPSQNDWTAFIQKTLADNKVPNPNDLKKLANKEDGFGNKPVEITTEVDTSNWKSLTNSVCNYTIHYPINWDIDHDISKDKELFLISNRDSFQSELAALRILVQDTLVDSNVLTYASIIVNGAQKSYTNVKLLESKRIRIGTSNYYFMLLSLTDDHGIFEMESWIRITKHKTYVLELLALKDISDKLRKTGEAIMASFTLN